MKEITVDAAVEQINAVTDFVNAQLEAVDCPMRAQMQIDIAIDELFSNIAHYAYGDGGGSAVVRVETGEGFACITFIDRGKPFNPLETESPDVTLSAEDRQIGGLGIFMVKQCMDAVEYENADGENRLKVVKKW